MRYEGSIYRPPGEAYSYLLQVSVGCPHNTCTFCSMYKDKRYHVRGLDDILEDIDMAKSFYGDVEKVFLCDGDALALDTPFLLEILNKLYSAFPGLKRVTTYAGPISTLEKSPEELVELREAGLHRAYLGVESGDDRVLKDIRKGVSAGQMIEAGGKLVRAGIDLWAIILIGLAGRGPRSREHALRSAEAINKINPRHLSALTYMPVEGTRLYEDIEKGKFELLTPFEALEETKILVENIELDGLHFTSNHASNYLPIKCTLKRDRDQVVGAIDKILASNDPGLLRSEFSRGL